MYHIQVGALSPASDLGQRLAVVFGLGFDESVEVERIRSGFVASICHVDYPAPAGR
jgi:hypothetical protein